MGDSQPLVSVITPVYNGELYLGECIESVLLQTYHNFEYIIVNNCSTDKTLEIAETYSRRDQRIKVVSNPKFVGAIENHNIAFKLISNCSKYCKVVSADDWIYPECISKLVELAECNPTVGIVGSYSIEGHGIRFPGLPPGKPVFSGHQVCRNFLMGSIGVFGVPTTVLYRSSLVRSSDAFFPASGLNADMAACLVYLQSCDFGFVHQILSFERVHNAAMSTRVRDLNGFLVDRLEFVSEYGHIFLTKREKEHRVKELLKSYYDFLGSCYLTVWDTEFWNYHKERIAKIGYPLYCFKLGLAILKNFLDLLLNPKQTVKKIVKLSIR
jgi:glycosyltransferase involved in cell wall biosynthesis